MFKDCLEQFNFITDSDVDRAASDSNSSHGGIVVAGTVDSLIGVLLFSSKTTSIVDVLKGMRG